VILVTVGTQLPFDRLIAIMDRIAISIAEPVVAQTGLSRYMPQAMRWRQSWDPIAFEQLVSEARVVVAHAGIGSVLSAQRHGKPVVLVARSAILGEHRNDHQRATAARFAGRPGIYVAETEAQVRDFVTRAVLAGPAEAENAGDRENLIAAIADYLSALPS
jgi:UDP-N-acetylglucosamine transferase subunit ALG13